jgi:hypothetical protein
MMRSFLRQMAMVSSALSAASLSISSSSLSRKRSGRHDPMFAGCTCELRPQGTNHLPPTDEDRSALDRLKQVEAGQAVEDVAREQRDRMRASAKTGRRAQLTPRMAPPSTGQRVSIIFLDIRSADRSDFIILLASWFR